jgi:hypothetical protein
MGFEYVPRCQHVKVNGTQCGSPALRNRRRCYFHDRVRVERAKDLADQFAQRRFVMPVLEDANSVQVALMKVMQMLARGQMEAKTAALMLYGLQTASANLKNLDLEVEDPTDVVIDRDTVDRTCIRGPQWFEEDFVEEEEDSEENEENEEDGERNGVAAAGAELRAEAGGAEAGPEKAAVEVVQGEGRKMPEQAETDEAPEWMQQVMRTLVPGGDGTGWAGTG